MQSGGAIVTDFYEADADSFQAQLQEHRRDIGRAISVQLGEAPPVLPSAAQRAGMALGFDGGGPRSRWRWARSGRSPRSSPCRK